MVLETPNASNTQDLSQPSRVPFFRGRKMHTLHVKPVGRAVEFKCRAGGYPTPNITWYKNDDMPTRDFGIVKYHIWSMILEDLVLTDAGNYTCRVCNSLGCIHFTYTLDVIGK